MKLYTHLNAALTDHTVQTDRGLVAGYLVRSLGGRTTLGYIWSADPHRWCWRHAEGLAYGERVSLAKAVEAVRDTFDALAGHARLPFDVPPPSDADIRGAWRSVEPRPARTPRREAQAAPSNTEPPPRVSRAVVWNDAAPVGDLSAAIRARLRK